MVVPGKVTMTHFKVGWLFTGAVLSLLLVNNSVVASEIPEFVTKSGCRACHNIERGKLIGPPLSWVSYRYKDDREAGKKAILDAMANGSNRRWLDYGFMTMMPPTSKKVSDDVRQQLVNYILNLEPAEPEKPRWMK